MQAQDVLKFDLADRLVKARRIADVKQSEIAEELGVRRQTVSAYESGLVIPRVGFLRLWAMRCGVPFEWLRSGDLPEPPLEPAGIDNNQVNHLSLVA